MGVGVGFGSKYMRVSLSVYLSESGGCSEGERGRTRADMRYVLMRLANTRIVRKIAERVIMVSILWLIRLSLVRGK
jgi:hypothetical protein